MIENTDARKEYIGWLTSITAIGHPWAAPRAVNISFDRLIPKMARPLELFSMGTVDLHPVSQAREALLDTAPSVVCGEATVPGNGGPTPPLILACSAADHVITNVTFASYGAPTGSCASGFQTNTTCHSSLSTLVAEVECLAKNNCTFSLGKSFIGQSIPEQRFGLVPCLGVTMRLAIVVTCGPWRGGPTMLADFGQEFQGGLTVNATGIAGQRIHIVTGELRGPLHTPGVPEALVSNTWGASFLWTLRDGPQTLSQVSPELHASWIPIVMLYFRK